MIERIKDIFKRFYFFLKSWISFELKISFKDEDEKDTKEMKKKNSESTS